MAPISGSPQSSTIAGGPLIEKFSKRNEINVFVQNMSSMILFVSNRTGAALVITITNVMVGVYQ